MLIKKLFSKYPNQKKFLIALSGGVDSTVLLHQLIIWNNKYNNIKIRAIHINHNLHPHALSAQKHCENICKKNKIHITLKQIQISQKNKYGIEGSARKKRLKIFKKNLLPKEVLLMAHNLNDQCENLFLSLKRKRGSDGLSGMKFVSIYKKIIIIRPLLHIKKEKIISWATSNKIIWIDDPSNKYLQYDRNFLRNIILSKIHERWPYFLKNCIHSMKILASNQKSLNFFVQNFIKKNSFLNKDLSLLNFHSLPIEAIYSILKEWLEKRSSKSIKKNIIKRLHQEIIINKNYHNKKIIFNKKEIRRFQNTIYYIHPYKNIKKTILYWKNILIPLRLPNNLGELTYKQENILNNKKNIYLPAPKKINSISIRFHISRKYICHKTKKRINIKKIWQKYNIPPWMRNNIPLLFYDEIFIAGIGVFSMYKPPFKNKKYIKIIWTTNIIK
ncbi:tRNA lysidine(34) synthetase TilS [Buchnera aphidicola]|uniref:tRNA(Ile)-lysidine synthase n=1 Tax=Buchnera aphidicola (Cinara strobi) TaxID=1921549 RepID=A0A3B1DVN4_9GAMM|nr:tRNA lysidine(34) synthetase TilS [Buchnera aphidicola]VAX76323.1 tRNA(Ile)-lysidine synthase [Buchnera aphidicola (Cinara strobi)]